MRTNSTKIIEVWEKRCEFLKYLRRDMAFYLMLLPAVAAVVVFSYIPMAGILISFQDYDFIKGFGGSSWVGLKHIENIFRIPALLNAVKNTISLNVFALAICFLAPVLFALLLNEIRDGFFKKTVQTISYLPHFLSWISVVAIVYNLMGTNGIVNDLRVRLLGPETERIMYMGIQSLFVPNYIILQLWKGVGWGTIIYLAAITGIDQQLYEAAAIDGSNRFQNARYITLPSLLPTIVILFILNVGGLFGSNFELVYGLQNVYVQYDVISTLIYRNGIQQANYSMTTAIGLVQGIMSFALVAFSNFLSKKVNEISLW